MSARRVVQRPTFGRRIGLGLTLLLITVGSARAADPTLTGVVPAVSQQAVDAKGQGQVPGQAQPIAQVKGQAEGKADADIQQVGCPSCGGGVLNLGPVSPSHGFHGGGTVTGGGDCMCDDDCGGCSIGHCYPGREPCECCHHGTFLPGRLAAGFVHAICCPDPCYEGRWCALADTAFFVDAARPITQTRIRTDFALDHEFPDRAELLWAQIGRKGPRNGPTVPGTNVLRGERRVNYQDLRLYTEGAIDRFSLSLELPFRNMDPESFPGGSGFADMVIATKSMLLDSEMMQCTFQFKTFIPTGNATKGLGTGHVSLEPAMLSTLKLYPNLYLQMMLAYRFPIGGSPGFAGSVTHAHFALNRVLWSCGKDVQLLGTLEAGFWKIHNGAFTDPITGLPLPASAFGDIGEAGPGVRLVICDRIDVGVGSQFAFTNDRFTSQFVRMEFRWRF